MDKLSVVASVFHKCYPKAHPGIRKTLFSALIDVYHVEYAKEHMLNVADSRYQLLVAKQKQRGQESGPGKV